MRESNSSGKKPIEEVEAQRLRKAKFERVRSVSKCKKPELPLATVGTTEEKARRKTGIDILGEVRWGTHFCVFYQSKQDLIDILVPYFKEGLENNEFCMWVTSEPLSAEDAGKSLSQAVTNLDDYIKKGQIEILDYSDWYTKSGVFEADRVLQGWVQKHDEAIKRGFDGLRITGNTLWLEKKDWSKFVDYEAVVNSVICKYRMLAICTYCLDKCGASEILDVENNHQFALIKWRGDWKILESSSKNQLEARLVKQRAITQALERSKKDWVKTFNAMSDWVALIDVGGRILRSNQAGENFTGKTLDEIIGQSCCRLVHGSDRHIPGCPLRTMLHSRQQASAELNVPNTDRWLMVTVDPVVDGKGNIVGAVHITRDITQRKKDEKALQESKERYKYLFEQSPLGIGLTTPDGRVVCANKAMGVITGYFEEELKKINLADIYENPQDRKKLLETIERYGCAVDFPTRLKRKDGTIYDALLNVSRIHLAGKDLFQTICMDITERKKAEVALRESEDRYRDLFEAANDIVLAVGANGQIIDINRQAEELTGFTKQELLQKNVLQDLIVQEDKGKIQQVIQNLMKGLGQIYEVRWRTKDGRILHFEGSSSARLTKEGKFVCTRCILRDISERRRMEEALRKSEEHYRMMAESINDGLGQLDEDGRYVYVNKRYAEILGCSTNKMVGRHWSEFFDEEARKIIERQLTERRKGKAEAYEVENTTKDDLRVWLRISPQPIFDADGRFRGSISILADITDRKKAEEQIEKLARFPAENPNPVLRVSGYGTVIYGNKNSSPLLKVWQCRAGESLPDEWYEVVLDALSSGQSQQTEVKCDGRVFSLTFAPVTDANYVNVYGLDITERKQAEGTLRIHGEIMTNMSEGVYLIRASDGVIVYTNPKFEEMFGYRPGELIGKHVSVINAPTEKTPKEIAEEIIKVLNEKGSWRGEICNIKKDGTLFWCYASVSIFDHPEHGKIWVTMHTDITERRQAEKKLLEDQEQLRSMASELSLVEERERRHIAEGLHDEISQPLVFLSIKLDLLKKSAKERSFVDSFSEMQTTIGKLISSARSLTFDLSSPVLHELGLEAGIEDWLHTNIQAKHGIATTFEDDGQIKPLDDDMGGFLFKAVKELLVNVVKHAKASSVKVSIVRDEDKIKICVEDNGVGFNPAEKKGRLFDPSGYGLFSIHERLDYLRGSFDIESKLGHGTRVTLVAPLKIQGTEVKRGLQ